MWVAAEGGYANLSLQNNASVLLISAGPHSGQYAVRFGVSTDVAYFTTEEAANTALAALMTSIGFTTVEGDV